MEYQQQIVRMLESKVRSLHGDITRKFSMFQGAIPFQIEKVKREDEEVYEVIFKQTFARDEKDIIDKYYETTAMLEYFKTQQ